MGLGSGSWGYRSEDASYKHLRVLICALVASINIHLNVCGELFNRDLCMFTEMVVGLEAQLDFSDLSSAGSPSALVAPLSDTCSDIEDFSSGVVELVE